MLDAEGLDGNADYLDEAKCPFCESSWDCECMYD